MPNSIKSFFKIELDKTRIFGLDVLRALAIMFVVIGHGGNLIPVDTAILINNIAYYDGVSIFFVLSGFLIGGILIKIVNEKGLNRNILMNFWIRRWFRTLPNYFLILLVICFLNILYNPDFTIKSVWKFFIFSQNTYTPHPLFFWEAWSLSIEEWFYLLIPAAIAVLLWVGKMRPKAAILFTALTVIGLVMLLRYHRYGRIPINTYDDWDQIFRKQVVTRIDSLMFGVVGAYISFYYKKVWNAYQTPLLLIGIYMFIIQKFVFPLYTPINGLYSTVFSFSYISLATLFLLPYLSNLKTGKGIILKVVTYLSLISYSMYLLNLSVIQMWIINQIHWNSFSHNVNFIAFLKYILYWVLLIPLSILTYKYFEVPMTKLRDNKVVKRLFWSNSSVSQKNLIRT